MTYTYLLKLENNCWYVGKSESITTRLKQHFTGKGSAWTKKHKPVALAGLWEGNHELLAYWAVKEMKGQATTRGAGYTPSI